MRTAITDKLREAIPALGEKQGRTGRDASMTTDRQQQGRGLRAHRRHFPQGFAHRAGLGLIGILIYITVRFEFSFALGGFVAILHDVIISIGLVVLLGSELSLIHVGAILTVAGYSINDTIVVFDRIRESLLIRTGSIKEIMNEAINITLSRTVLTSLTTIITVAILSIFGGVRRCAISRS